MHEINTARIGTVGMVQCPDRTWTSTKDKLRYGADNLDNIGKYNSRIPVVEPKGNNPSFTGLIHIGQRVFSPEDKLVGLTTKLFLNSLGQISHLAVRTAHLFGQHKMVPITAVSDVNSVRVLLSIPPDRFKKLPDYRDDASIAEEVDRAFWKDAILRNIDYHQIDVQVRDGIVILNGYVASSSQWRVEAALTSIPAILGVKSNLVADDKLLLQITSALIEIERMKGSHVFAKVQNGVVELSGEAISIGVRDLAEKEAGNIPWIRGVINDISVPGTELPQTDQRFLQPMVGQNIYFRDGPSGVVEQVIINRSSRRVTGIIMRGQFSQAHSRTDFVQRDEVSTPERLAVIPIKQVRFLSGNSGFLLIDSTDTTQIQDYDPASVIRPDADWVPPYPYCIEHVRFWLNKDLGLE
jgi:osmotically-inducible protein OsmY